jgi:hypothetical protein
LKNKKNVLATFLCLTFIASSLYAQNNKTKNNNNISPKANSSLDVNNEKTKASYSSCVVELKKQIKLFESCLSTSSDDSDITTALTDAPKYEPDKKDFNCSFENNSSLKEGNNYYKVGIFEFGVPSTLNSDQSSINVALDILKSEEDSYGRPAFSFNVPNGGLIFGLWIQEDEGDLVTTREIISWLPQPFPSEWQIRNLNEFTERKYAKFGYSYVSIAAEGKGDGKFFGSKNLRPTLAIWYHIPVFYKENNKLKTGRLKLYARTAAECKKNTEDLLQEIMTKLEPNPNFTLISEANYIQNLPPKKRQSK